MGTSNDLAVDDLLADYQPFASEFQMDAFIVAGNGYHHIWGMYQQCLRELRVRSRNCDEHDRLLRENLQEQKTTEGIEAERLASQFEELKLTARDNEREFDFYTKKARELKAVLGDITPELRREMELDFWAHKHAYSLGVALESRSGIAASFWESLPGFPVDIRRKLTVLARTPIVAQMYLDAFLDSDDQDCTRSFDTRFQAAVAAADEAMNKRRALAAEQKVTTLPCGDAGYRILLPDEVDSTG
jgi:hypothetical protein